MFHSIKYGYQTYTYTFQITPDMKLKLKTGKLLPIKFLVGNLKLILFIVGFSLTLWRAKECVKKYLNYNLSTRVTLVKSYQTVQPNIVVCPLFFAAYNTLELKKIGISVDDYRNGNWTGNSTRDGKLIFKNVTYKLDNLGKGSLKMCKFVLFYYKIYNI